MWGPEPRGVAALGIVLPAPADGPPGGDPRVVRPVAPISPGKDGKPLMEPAIPRPCGTGGPKTGREPPMSCGPAGGPICTSFSSLPVTASCTRDSIGSPAIISSSGCDGMATGSCRTGSVFPILTDARAGGARAGVPLATSTVRSDVNCEDRAGWPSATTSGRRCACDPAPIIKSPTAATASAATDATA